MNTDAPQKPLQAPKIALVIEGGGMRAAYTSGLLCVLIEKSVEFGVVCGISAGSSCAVNYVSRDSARTRASFVELAGDPHMGGKVSFLRGKGYFDSEYLYGDLVLKGNLPFDWKTFSENPAEIYIQGFERDTGRSVIWGREHMQTVEDMLRIVRASSTMPGLMRPVTVDGQVVYDGGLGLGAGIPTRLAQQAGYERYFVICTQPFGYVKHPLAGARRSALLRICRHYPYMRDALLTRAERYNAELAHLAELEAQGKALVVRPETMPVKNTTLSVQDLELAFNLGHTQGLREWDRWEQFLRQA